MKRNLVYSLVIVAVLAGAYTAFGRPESGSTIIVKPSEMRDGETKTFTDDGRTVTITRDGNATHVKIDGAGQTRNITITSDDSGIRIEHGGLSGRTLIVGPDRPRILIDGKPLGALMAPQLPDLPRRKSMTWFVCPKDHTTLQVPAGQEEKTYKCPVDGTTMEKKKGHGFGFFFDDDHFTVDDL